MKRRALSMLAGLALLLGGGAAQAQASNTIKFGLCYDLSKAYTFVTPQIVQAAKDYATLLNAKGGLEGHPIEIVVQDHGNEPQRGIECYEKLKREGVMLFDYLSTPVSRAVLPRHMADGIRCCSPSSAAVTPSTATCSSGSSRSARPTGARWPTTSPTSRRCTRAT